MFINNCVVVYMSQKFHVFSFFQSLFLPIDLFIYLFIYYSDLTLYVFGRERERDTHTQRAHQLIY